MSRLFSILVLLSASCWGSVAFVTSANSGEVSSTTATTASITVSGSTPVLVIGIAQNTSGTVSGVTFSGGGTASRIIRITQSTNGFAELWCVPSAPAGAGTVNATFSTTGDIYVVAALFTGADATTPCPVGDAVSIADTNTNTSLTLTPAHLTANDASVGMVSLTNSGDVATPWVQNNDIYHNVGGTSDTEMGYSTGTASVTANWVSGSVNKSFAAVRIQAVAGTAKVCTMTMMGMGPC